MLPDTKVIYSKAAYANELKNKIKLLKVRELNDLHHAKDAYINIISGNILYTKFQGNAAVYFKEHDIDSYNLTKLYDENVKGAWKREDKKRILSIALKNTCRIVSFTYEGKGKFFDENLLPAKPNNSLIPAKGKGPLTNTSKYGGYDNAKSAYFMLVKSKNKKGKSILSLECVTVLANTELKTIKDKQDYCIKLGLDSPEIVIPYIKLNTLLCVNGSYCRLTARTNNQLTICNATQLYLQPESVEHLKRIINYLNFIVNKRSTANDEIEPEENKPKKDLAEKIDIEKNLKLYDTFVEKLSSPIYSGLSNLANQVQMLLLRRDRFSELSLKDQCKVLYQILKLLQCNSQKSDFSLLGDNEKKEKKSAGVLTLNKFIDKYDIKMITSSPTGYYYKVIDFKSFL